MTAIMTATVVLAALNAVLAIVLGTVYWRNHREIRSPFTLGLLLFALFLVVHSAMILYHYWTMMPAFGAVNETFLLVEGILQTAALGVLLSAVFR